MAERKVTKQTNQAQIAAAQQANTVLAQQKAALETKAAVAFEKAKPIISQGITGASKLTAALNAQIAAIQNPKGIYDPVSGKTTTAAQLAQAVIDTKAAATGVNKYGGLTTEQVELGKALGKEKTDAETAAAAIQLGAVPDPIYETITEQYTSPDEIQAMINAALATQQAKFDALTKQAAADKEAALVATRTKAKDKLTAMLAPYKLEGIASYIDAEIMKDNSEEMILLGLYDQPAYKTRFPGMDALRKAGRVISEKEYSSIENAMMQTARFFDLPKGFYDGSEDFGNLIGKQVSAKEYQDRLQIGQDLARTLNSGIKTQLLNLYNVGEGDLTAYVLDPDKALSLIQKQAKAATFVSLGRAAGFGLPSITAGQAENIVATEPYAKLTENQMQTKLGQAGELLKEQQRLSQIEGMTYSEQEALDAVISGDTKAVLASQQRAQREVARFSSRGGITGSSLGSSINV